MVVFACKRKLIKSRLTDGLKMVTFYFALDRPENQLAGRDGEKRVGLR